MLKKIIIAVTTKAREQYSMLVVALECAVSLTMSVPQKIHLHSTS